MIPVAIVPDPTTPTVLTGRAVTSEPAASDAVSASDTTLGEPGAS